MCTSLHDVLCTRGRCVCPCKSSHLPALPKLKNWELQSRQKLEMASSEKKKKKKKQAWICTTASTIWKCAHTYLLFAYVQGTVLACAAPVYFIEGFCSVCYMPCCLCIHYLHAHAAGSQYEPLCASVCLSNVDGFTFWWPMSGKKEERERERVGVWEDG